MSDSIHSWIALHDPELHTGKNGILHAHTRDTLKALSATTNRELAPSQARVTGGRAAEAISINKKAQIALQQQGASGPDFIEIFKKDLAGAAVTLSEMARKAADYQPQTLDNTGATSAAYENYLGRMGTNPLFNLKLADVLTYTRSTSDWNEAIDAIANTFEGIAAGDKNTIINGLKSLAQAASSKMSTTQTENLFVQNAMNIDGVVSLYLYSSKVSFKEEKGKGYDTKQTDYEIRRVKFELQTDLWPSYAAAVAAKFTASVDDWLNNNSTSTAGTQPIPALNPS